MGPVRFGAADLAPGRFGAGRFGAGRFGAGTFWRQDLSYERYFILEIGDLKYFRDPKKYDQPNLT